MWFLENLIRRRSDVPMGRLPLVECMFGRQGEFAEDESDAAINQDWKELL